MTTVIRNGNVLTPDCNGFSHESLWIKGETIVAPQNQNEPIREIDAGGLYVLPGLIDMHTHGAVGINYSSDDVFERALTFQASNGVTSILPTIGVRSMDDILHCIDHVRAQKMQNWNGASIEGIHLEGPFVSAEKKGAMNTPEIPCSLENFNQIADIAGDLLKVMTIAPEIPNALDVIAAGHARGIRMSIGHTNATYAETMAAIAAGAAGATHTFNAMRAYEHREPGVLGAVLTDNTVTCETICDMIHLSPVTIRLIRQCKGLDGMILVSDSGKITGLGDGAFLVDGKTRYVKDGVARNAEGRIAGSCFTMADGARRLIEQGYSLPEVARIGAWNPAKALGLGRSETL